MNEAYRALLDARVEGAVAIAKAYSRLNHKLLKGELREIVIRDLLRPFFPSDVGLGTGEIVSAVEGAGHSAQQDVILFNRRILPPLLGDERTGLFPIESVLATLEIKSRLTVEELKQSHVSAKSVHRLEIQPGGDKQKDAAAALIPRLTCLLAFDTDLAKDGKHEMTRYEEIRDGRYAEPPAKKDNAPGVLIPKNDPPALMVICVVGRGLWWWHYGRKAFMKTELARPFDEVASLVTILGNSYRTLTMLRGEPPIGRYLFPIGGQIFDEVPFEILRPDLVEKANASAAQMLAKVKRNRRPPPAASSQDDDAEQSGK
jgi:hypothetical protein